jgi:hypothetical protein
VKADAKDSTRAEGRTVLSLQRQPSSHELITGVRIWQGTAQGDRRRNTTEPTDSPPRASFASPSSFWRTEEMIPWKSCSYESNSAVGDWSMSSFVVQRVVGAGWGVGLWGKSARRRRRSGRGSARASATYRN